ncbi:MAG: carboxypeptidase regulatory-like domain-containing protein [Candidatus Sulfotelmatobacter sp.]|jgi:hypothetical protein
MLSTRSCLAAALLVLAVSLIVTTTAWGATGIDVTTSMDQGSAKNTVSTSAFSTSSGNELLLAFISADSTASPNTTVTQVAGGGLPWVLVERANVQLGTAEIWRAFAPSALSGVTGGVHFLRRRGSHWSIQGNISPSSSGTGATVALTQGSATVATTTVGAAGSYSFSDVIDGTYRVTPSNAGYVFAPSSQNVTVNGASITGVNFTAALPTGSIQGNISPSSSSTGATVTLTQGSTTIAATTVDSNGNYSLNGVVNGTYSVTPTKSGYAYTPLSQSVTVNGAPVTSINFTASAVPTYSISGMISPSANGSGAIVTLSGTASATTTADTSGTFSFGGLANGSYTVTATNAGFAISPASQPVSVNNAPVTGVNFTATLGLAIDVVTYGDSNSPSTTAVTSTFSTAASNELLLAFISADSTASPNTTVTQVAGGGLTWVLVERANVQLGTAEIWRAFAPSVLSGVTVTATLSQKVDSSITVMSFSGVNTSGTNGSGAIGALGSGNADPGAPTATLVTTANGSLVLGVGNDWDNAIARTLGPNQTMVHQFLANVGDTYWVQRESNATSLSGTSVTLNDSAPTSDRYNLTIVEVLPAPAGTVGTYGIFGTLSPSTQGSGATVTLSGTASGTTTADGSGNYGFSGLSSGSYTVTPSKSGYSFSPAAQSATINGANVAVNFTVSSSPPPVVVSISPTSATVTTGGTQQFTATLQNTSNTAVTWQVNGVTGGNTTTGTISSSGLYTGPGTVPNPATVTVTAISQADPSKSASAQMTITPPAPVSVTISPTSATVTESGIQQFTATVTNCGNNCGVNWSVTQGSGKVNSSGLYTAPNQQESDTVRAQAQADLTKTANASVTVPPVGITISPTSATVAPNGTQQFTATVTGTVNTGVTWSEVGNGTVNQSGLYTAPSTNENDTVTATANAAPNLSASASVTVQNQNQSNCGYTLNWTNSACQTPASGQLNTAIVNGVNDPNAWTIISRHGEYAQSETECNGPWDVSVLNGYLRIKTEATSRTCGDFNPSTGAQCSGAGSPCPGNFPYSTGDVQWNAFNFKYGVLITRQRAPQYQTSLWPGSGWLLTTKCQVNNKYTGDTGFDGCPSPGQSGYNEMDVDEFYNAPSGWPQFHIANPSFGFGGGYPSAPVDSNWHVYSTVWTANSVQQYLDGTLEFSTTSSLINDTMFYIFQTQTGGVGGTPNNSLLPAYLDLDYIKVCNATYSLAQCQAAATNGSDPNVIFYDDFGGPAQ